MRKNGRRISEQGKASFGKRLQTPSKDELSYKYTNMKHVFIALKSFLGEGISLTNKNFTKKLVILSIKSF